MGNCCGEPVLPFLGQSYEEERKKVLDNRGSQDDKFCDPHHGNIFQAANMPVGCQDVAWLRPHEICAALRGRDGLELSEPVWGLRHRLATDLICALEELCLPSSTSLSGRQLCRPYCGNTTLPLEVKFTTAQWTLRCRALTLKPCTLSVLKESIVHRETTILASGSDNP
jgi:hypothetical protein